MDLIRLWRHKGKRSSALPALLRTGSVDAMRALDIPVFSDLFIFFSFNRQTDGPQMR
ncbi:hypothetical protein [uncultured Sulfitobacter sp.]|mgnify:FL=1|uniref:hypothetical protein n=1 Tax=uncultured Sulfitobacter sp. TaxID=191468 RepID=UPI0030D718EA|tara:strand:- start:179606 stop:179776 length:171 start_codon:yes stop_codon:yes gene_type:complete